MNCSVNAIDTRINLYKHFPKNGKGAEIGVCRGSNSMHLYQITKPTIFYLIDTWKFIGWEKTHINHNIELHYGNWKNDVEEIFSEEIEKNIVFTRRMTGIDFLGTLEDRSLDWIYLDSDHNYDNIKEEMRLAINKLKIGGVLAGHDFMVHEKAWRAGVIRSVIEFIQDGLIKMEYITNETFSSYLCRVL